MIECGDRTEGETLFWKAAMLSQLETFICPTLTKYGLGVVYITLGLPESVSWFSRMSSTHLFVLDMSVGGQG